MFQCKIKIYFTDWEPKVIFSQVTKPWKKMTFCVQEVNIFKISQKQTTILHIIQRKLSLCKKYITLKHREFKIMNLYKACDIKLVIWQLSFQPWIILLAYSIHLATCMFSGWYICFWGMKQGLIWKLPYNNLKLF